MWAAVAGALDPEPVDLEPQTSEPAPDTLDAEDETADTWAVPHEVHLVHQVESRPGPPGADGARWMERRKTGLALGACQCGWTTGWIPAHQLPDQLQADHPDRTQAR